MITKIVSGGQTGVDRAALDVALDLRIDCGGWCPQGRRAEDGAIDEKYPLRETPWHGYPQRTEWNVRDSDGTLILTTAEPDRGTALTKELAEKRRKPCLVVNPTEESHIQKAREWLKECRIAVLNVAGPRESSSPGIHQEASHFLLELIRGLEK